MTERLTSAELVVELRAAAGEGGWLSSYLSQEGLAPLPGEKGLSDVVKALERYAEAAFAPEAVARHLQRAAAALAAVRQVDEGAATYESLGTALAYLVQARRAAETSA